jgi:hypothetical protein
MKHNGKGGRPALNAGDTPAKVNLTLPSKDYDQAHTIATRDRVSVPTVLRRAITQFLKEGPTTERK